MELGLHFNLVTAPINVRACLLPRFLDRFTFHGSRSCAPRSQPRHTALFSGGPGLAGRAEH